MRRPRDEIRQKGACSCSVCRGVQACLLGMPAKDSGRPSFNSGVAVFLVRPTQARSMQSITRTGQRSGRLMWQLGRALPTSWWPPGPCCCQHGLNGRAARTPFIPSPSTSLPIPTCPVPSARAGSDWRHACPQAGPIRDPPEGFCHPEGEHTGGMGGHAAYRHAWNSPSRGQCQQAVSLQRSLQRRSRLGPAHSSP